jgi:hypothetical protein
LAAEQQEPEPKVTMTWIPAPERTDDFEALLRVLFEPDRSDDQSGDVPSDDS